MSKEVHRIYFCKDGVILDTQIKEGEDVTDTLNRCFKKISDLEAKLAESEKENMELASKVDLLESEKENLFRTLEEANDEYQDKISFTVEKLVDVQKYISDNAVFVEEECFGREINDFIDNQIEQLKEME